MTDMQALADIYALQQSAPPPLFSPVRWRAGGWQIVLVEDGDLAGEYVGYEQAGQPQVINRRIVMTAVDALQRCRRLSPQELMSLELGNAGDVVSDDYYLATELMTDDYGFVLEPGAGYRRTVLTVANCTLTHTWSPVAAFAWSKGLPGMGVLGAAVDRARRLEGVVREG